MKTGIQMLQDCRPIINVSDVTDLLDGGNIYILERPQNSDKNDIVLNTLALTNEQLQQGVFNVNIHTPNKKNVVVGGETDNTQPDISVMGSLTNIITALLKDYVGYDFRLSAQNTGLPVRDVDNRWYVNIRVDYFSVQPNYSNI